MDKLFFTKKLCAPDAVKRTKIKIMEDLGHGRQRYRVRAKHSIMRSDNSNDEPNSTKVPFTSREVQFQVIAKLIHWMLSTKFSSFFLFSCIVFISLTFFFALVIILLSYIEPRCVTSNVFERNSDFPAGFNDALSLSWTTFTTVGYGVVSPSTSAKFQDQMEHFDKSGGCAFMSIALSFESLVGILLVSYAGAIMYVKLIQFQSNAQVAFSSVMVVKYGKGVEAGDVDDVSTDSEQEKTLRKGQKVIPCPVLVFRMVNLLNSTKNGEIVDAHVNTVATVNLKNAVMSHITRGNTVFENALQTDIKTKILGKHAYAYRTKAKRTTSSDRIGKIMSSRKFLNLSSRTTQSEPILHPYPPLLGNGSDRSTSTVPSLLGNGSERSASTVPSLLGNGSERSTSTAQDQKSNVSNTMRSSMKIKNVMFQFGMSQEQVDLTHGDIFETAQSEAGNLSDTDNEGEDYVSQEIRFHPPGLGKCVFHKEADVEMPNMVFAKVSMDPVNHPYFCTSWRVVHVLNEESPLLQKEIRKKIKDVGGSWPDELNTQNAVEDSIDFDQFLVSFRGLSKSTGTEVYSHNVYKKDDLRVGYQFKSILVSNANGSVGIVPEDIDEIRPQYGGIL